MENTTTTPTPHPVSRLTAEEWLIVSILAAVNFTHIMDFVIMMPLGPQLIRVFGIDAQRFGLVVSSYTFSAAISGLLGAFFIDRFDRKKALVTTYLGFSIGTLLCAFAPNYSTLVGARIFAGAFGGLVGSLVFSILGDAVDVSRRGRATGIVMSAFSLASVIGIPVGLELAVRFDWHAPFVLLGVGSLLACALAAWRLPSLRGHLEIRPSEKRDPMREMGSILTDRNHQRAFLLTIAMMFAGFSVIPFMSPYMVSNVGLQEKQLSWIYLCGGLFTFFSSQIIGFLCDRYGKHRMFAVMALTSIPAILLVTHLPPLPLPLALACTTLFMVTVSGRFVPTMALVTSAAAQGRRGGFMSVNSCIQQGSSGLASLAGGLILTTSASGALLHYNVVGYMAVAATLLCLFLARNIVTR